MEEQLISFETAKLAKENNFIPYELAIHMKELDYPQQPRLAGYDKISKQLQIKDISINDISAPTWQQVEEYLRNKFDYSIKYSFKNKKFSYKIYYKDQLIRCDNRKHFDDEYIMKTEAVLNAIIKSVKQTTILKYCKHCNTIVLISNYTPYQCMCKNCSLIAGKQYYQKNKERLLKYAKDHKKKFNESKRKAFKKKYNTNPEFKRKVLDKHIQYQKDNVERLRIYRRNYMRAYVAKHKEEINEYSRERKKERYHSDPEFRKKALEAVKKYKKNLKKI